MIVKVEGKAAVVESSEHIVTDRQSALDLMMTVKAETGCERMAVNKEAITEDFFILSTGLAGEILQMFVNYRVKFAVFGDFSDYTSKPLKDFIYESNQGHNVFFVQTADKALDMLPQ